MMKVKSRAKSPKAKEQKPIVNVTPMPTAAQAPAMPAKPKKKVYYSVNSKQCFTVPVMGSDGKIAIARNRRGDQQFIGGEPVLVTKVVKFTTVSSNVTKGLLCVHETSDPEEIKVLEKLSAQRDNDVMTNEEYQKSRNKEAFAQKVRAQGLEEENKSLKSGNEAAAKKVADLEKQVADLSKKPE